jgi:hypothetical protein
MVVDSTFGINATCARAWVSAFIVDTCFITRAVCVEYTLRTTTSIRVTKVFPHANTRTCTISFLANCVCTTRRWITRITVFFYWLYD